MGDGGGRRWMDMGACGGGGRRRCEEGGAGSGRMWRRATTMPGRWEESGSGGEDGWGKFSMIPTLSFPRRTSSRQGKAMTIILVHPFTCHRSAMISQEFKSIGH